MMVGPVGIRNGFGFTLAKVVLLFVLAKQTTAATMYKIDMRVLCANFDDAATDAGVTVQFYVDGAWQSKECLLWTSDKDVWSQLVTYHSAKPTHVRMCNTRKARRRGTGMGSSATDTRYMYWDVVVNDQIIETYTDKARYAHPIEGEPAIIFDEIDSCHKYSINSSVTYPLAVASALVNATTGAGTGTTTTPVSIHFRTQASTWMNYGILFTSSTAATKKTYYFAEGEIPVEVKLCAETSDSWTMNSLQVGVSRVYTGSVVVGTNCMTFNVPAVTTHSPALSPSPSPTLSPSSPPTSQPTPTPTNEPTSNPTRVPTVSLTLSPTVSPIHWNPTPKDTTPTHTNSDFTTGSATREASPPDTVVSSTVAPTPSTSSHASSTSPSPSPSPSPSTSPSTSTSTSTSTSRTSDNESQPNSSATPATLTGAIVGVVVAASIVIIIIVFVVAHKRRRDLPPKTNLAVSTTSSHRSPGFAGDLVVINNAMALPDNNDDGYVELAANHTVYSEIPSTLSNNNDNQSNFYNTLNAAHVNTPTTNSATTTTAINTNNNTILDNTLTIAPRMVSGDDHTYTSIEQTYGTATSSSSPPSFSTSKGEQTYNRLSNRTSSPSPVDEAYYSQL